MPEPGHNRGKSKQDYETPPDFIDAVVRKFGIIDFDLAASPLNAKTKRFFTVKDDALTKSWHTIKSGRGTRKAHLWLNPPYSNIRPWVQKCLEESWEGAVISLLVPAAVGSNWFRDFIFGQESVHVCFLNGRIKFVGSEDYYPKDCMLVRYNCGRFNYDSQFEVWTWRDEP